jgi:anti-sigma factor RsiW
MTCKDARASLGRDLDGRIGAEERGGVAAHLAGCAACREERLRWEAAAGALRAGGPTRVPAGLAARSYAAAMRSADAPLSLAAWFVDAARPTALAAAVAAVLVWAAASISPTTTASSADAGAQDPMELAMHLWIGEAGADAH